MSRSDRRAGVLGALRHRDLRRLVIAQGLSRAGDFIFTVGLMVYVLHRTGSATWVSVLVLMRLLPMLVLGPAAGLLADRLPRKLLMVAADVVRAALMMLLLAVIAVDGPLWAIALVTVLAGILGTPYLPASMAAVPQLVEEDQLAGANAAVSAVDYLAILLGPALGGVIAATLSLEAAIAVNAASFVASALLVFSVRTPMQPAPQSAAARAEAPRESLVTELLAGLRAITGDRTLRALVGAVAAITLTYGFEQVYLILVAQDRLGIGASGVGWLEASVGLGGVAGAMGVSRLADTRRQRLLLVVVTLLCGLPLAAMSVITAPWLAFVLLFLDGAASVTVDVTAMTAMQRGVQPDRLARADAVLTSLAVACALLGTLLAPWLLRAVGLEWALAVAGVVPAGVAIVALARRRELDAVMADRGPETQRDLELVRGTPALADLLPAAREILVAAMRPEHLDTGEVLVREGAPADAVWLVAEGTLDVQQQVSGATTTLTTVHGPDLVGEIGVLERRPRTATLVARTPCELRRVDADAFVEALAVADPDLPALWGLVGTRLARHGVG